MRSAFIPARIKTLLLATIGTAVFWALSLPLPFLFGPMIFCLCGALANVPLKGFGELSTAARTVLGVAVGASITPDVIAQLPRMTLSVALIPIYIAIIALIGIPFFRKLWRFDGPTAYYAAMPGGLQDMVIFGTEAGADPRALSLVHATRVLIVISLAPFILSHFYDTDLDNPIGVPLSALPWYELGIMVAAAWLGWKGGERIGLFGASILGPMIVTAALSLSGVVHFRPPAEAILAAQFLIGCGIGINFLGVTWTELTRFVAAGVAYVLLLSVITTIFTGIVSGLGLSDPISAFLAFAPGGQAEMTLLAIVTGTDLGFVVTHHLTRIILVIIGAPIVAGLLSRFTPSSDEN